MTIQELDIKFYEAYLYYLGCEYGKSYELCEELIKKDYPKAYRLMGMFFEDGVFEQNLQKAAEYYLMAYEKGDELAKYYYEFLFAIDVESVCEMLGKSNEYPLTDIMAICISGVKTFDKNEQAKLLNAVFSSYSLADIENELEEYIQIPSIYEDAQKVEFISNLFKIIDDIKKQNTLIIKNGLKDKP